MGISTSKCVNRFLLAKLNIGFDRSLTAYMLRRYAAGSSAGSGAFGKTTSGIDGCGGDLNTEPLFLNTEPLVVLEDCGRLRLKPALEVRLLVEDIEAPSIDAFEPLREKEPLRENRPIAGTNVESMQNSGYVLLPEPLSQAVQQAMVKSGLHFTLASF